MKFIPNSLSRKVTEQALLARKNSPSLLFGVGIVSMVGSTALACRATLKMEEVLSEVDDNLKQSQRAKDKVEAKDRALAHNKTAAPEDQQELNLPEDMTYDDKEMKRDVVIIYVRGVAKVVKLYAPALILGGVGVVCLTKSHSILMKRNAALTAAYIAVDTAFKTYRERVVERYGEDTDREMRYGAEEVTVIDDDTGKALETVRVEPGEPSGYARWFDESNANWTAPGPFDNYNWTWLRSQQNWANDMLHSRGHLFLNEVYSLIGMSHTSPGAVVGWVFDRENKRGDNFVSFGCWDENGQGHRFFEGMNGREGAILLDFNVDGPIWDLIDKRKNGEEHE